MNAQVRIDINYDAFHALKLNTIPLCHKRAMSINSETGNTGHTFHWIVDRLMNTILYRRYR